MESSRYSSMLVFAALLSSPLLGLWAADRQRPHAVVGAIRWDAWYGQNDVVREVERSLGPKKFHFRLPFFGQVVSDAEVRIDGDSQETMNREIAYAAQAGLNYWAFVDYWEDPALSIALRRYLDAKDKRGLQFCFVEEGGRLDGHRAEAWPRLVGFFRDPNYLKVCDGRPLLFVFGKPAATGKDDFRALGAAAVAAGLKQPYIVLMGWHPPSDWKDAQTLGCDAVSAYAAGGQYAGAMWPYAKLTEHVTSNYWGVCRQHGIPTLTFATAGWDTRPRIEHPVKWIKIPAVPDPTPPAQQKPLLDDVTATPAQLATHLQEALAWTADNPDLTPANAVILYAWNENDEGGWLVPTWTGQGQPNTDRIEAVGRVLNPGLTAQLLGPLVTPDAADPRPVYVVPNFHPASCGWLTDWSTERNYCANSYFDHLDRVRDDPDYNFALSECNNLIAMLNFRPDRAAELRQRIREGRVELCNAFFLEPTINLSGGEALVKMGVEGLRWQQQVLGVRPRLSWMIDVTGMHEQMAQIVAGLGLDALVYCRLNPTGSTLHWLESPDGTRTLAISPGHYLEWRPMFGAKEPLAENQLRALADDIRARIEPPAPNKDAKRPDAADLKSLPRRTPTGAPVLILGGSGDYNLAPLCRSYPSEFLRQFPQVAPEFKVQFTTPSRYLDAVLPGIQSGAIPLPVLRGGTEFTYNAFWIQNPRVKSAYRRCEQWLQAAEMLATAASLRGKFEYPARELHRAWLLMCLNMDRNTLWGAAGGMVFEHERSWDARDRFEWVERTSRDVATRALRSLVGPGTATVRFNPLNWQRRDVPELSACAAGPGSPPATPETTGLAAVIQTEFYAARLDPATGALVSLQLKSSGRELLGGPANVIVAEQPKQPIGSPADQMVDRPERNRVTDSNQHAAKLTVTASPLATIVDAESPFLGGQLRRKLIFHRDQPRIDFETELNDIPDRTVVVAEFPLAAAVREVRRGIPYGFSQAAWPEPNPALPGVARGITPAVRWSHYQLAGAGVALLDQGLSGREINGNTPILYLVNAAEKYRGYPNAWLSGAGRHVVRYALAAHEGDFAEARIPQLAWEFNDPPIEASGCAAAESPPILQSSDNVIVEALRREGDEIELRLAECLGRAAQASLTLNLPHLDAALTDMLGGRRQPLRGGPTYTFPVRPQQIVTLRFKTADAVSAVEPLLEWDELVPEHKREALRRYLPDVKGHPPAGGQ